MEKTDMTAREFFDAPNGAITLDNICNPEEKEFLLRMIELYAEGKVRQAQSPVSSPVQGVEVWQWVKANEHIPLNMERIFIRNITTKTGGMILASELLEMDGLEVVLEGYMVI